MRRFLFNAVLCAASGAGGLPVHAADVGISVSIGQPGYYGRLELGTYPPPQLIYRQPIVVERVPVGRPPIYLNVPPGQAKDWRKNCHRYNACGERVYFVQNDWYRREYVPRYHEYHRDHRHDRPDDYRDDYRGNDKNKHHGDQRDHGHNR